MKSYKSIDMVEKDDSSDTKTLVTPEEILMIGSFRGGTSCGPERIKFTGLGQTLHVTRDICCRLAVSSNSSAYSSWDEKI